MLRRPHIGLLDLLLQPQKHIPEDYVWREHITAGMAGFILFNQSWPYPVLQFEFDQRLKLTFMPEWYKWYKKTEHWVQADRLSLMVDGRRYQNLRELLKEVEAQRERIRPP